MTVGTISYTGFREFCNTVNSSRQNQSQVKEYGHNHTQLINNTDRQCHKPPYAKARKHDILLTTASDLMGCIESPETHSHAAINSIIVDKIACSSPGTCATTLTLNFKKYTTTSTTLDDKTARLYYYN